MWSAFAERELMPDKKCTRCHEIKSEDLFPWGKLKNGKTGPVCKECKRLQSVAWRKDHPEDYGTRPGRDEDYGDAIMSLGEHHRSNQPRPFELKSARSNMPFHPSMFDPEKARIRAIGSL